MSGHLLQGKQPLEEKPFFCEIKQILEGNLSSKKRREANLRRSLRNVVAVGVGIDVTSSLSASVLCWLLFGCGFLVRAGCVRKTFATILTNLEYSFRFFLPQSHKSQFQLLHGAFSLIAFSFNQQQKLFSFTALNRLAKRKNYVDQGTQTHDFGQICRNSGLSVETT